MLVHLNKKLQGGKINGFLERGEIISKVNIFNPCNLQVLGKVFLVLVKIVQFCSRFEEVKHKLERMERTKVILFVKSRIPIFLKQALEMFKAIKYATSELNTRLRQDLVAYFVVEIEELIFFFTNLGK